MRLSQEDQKTISQLQKEMEKTLKNVYVTQEKEIRARENITLLKEELATLSKLVERGASLSLSQENEVKQLRLAREELQRQVEEQNVQVILLEGKLDEQNSYQIELRDQVSQHLSTINDLKEKLTSKESDSVREVKRRLKTQKELQDARGLLDEKLKQGDSLLAELEAFKTEKASLMKQVADGQVTLDKYRRDIETQNVVLDKVGYHHLFKSSHLLLLFL